MVNTKTQCTFIKSDKKRCRNPRSNGTLFCCRHQQDKQIAGLEENTPIHTPHDTDSETIDEIMNVADNIAQVRIEEPQEQLQIEPVTLKTKARQDSAVPNDVQIELLELVGLMNNMFIEIKQSRQHVQDNLDKLKQEFIIAMKSGEKTGQANIQQPPQQKNKTRQVKITPKRIIRKAKQLFYNDFKNHEPFMNDIHAKLVSTNLIQPQMKVPWQNVKIISDAYFDEQLEADKKQNYLIAAEQALKQV